MKLQNLLFLLFIICVSCGYIGKDKKQTKIENFEKILGYKETQYLNEIVADFELYLLLKFKQADMNLNYKEYFKNLINNTITNPWNIDSVKKVEYKNFKLLPVYGNDLYPDSVWFDSELGMIGFYYAGDEIFSYDQYVNETNIDSLIVVTKNTPKQNKISESKFLIALDSIKSLDSSIAKYLDLRNYYGSDYPIILADGYLEFNVDCSDYFNKRIFIMEILLSK